MVFWVLGVHMCLSRRREKGSSIVMVVSWCFGCEGGYAHVFVSSQRKGGEQTERDPRVR